MFPLKSSKGTPIPYKDAVEEALCFGWIDSTVETWDKEHKIQKFSPRTPKSSYSQANKERLYWLAEHELIHPTVRRNFQHFSNPYKRIRIAYIEGTRKRPEEFKRRLKNFMEKAKQGKLIKGYGGIDKYY